ncbi:MAG: TonB-dependent receptor [Deltaproteobacteria bacterium]|nr:MAG: TonB-dependent receptor [Deltaproteobacteria bacterium]
MRSEIFFQNSLLQRAEIRAAYSRYFHQEFESSGILGIEFGVLTWHFSASAHFKDRGALKNGAIGIWSEYRDFAAGGLVFTPPTIEKSLAGFMYQEAVFGALGLSAALRYDVKNVAPEYEKDSIRIGLIRERNFGNFSASASAVYRLDQHVHLGTTLMRSFRAPGIEELFSEGPHLAAYAFEIGNPELGQETGFGSEIFIHFEHKQAHAEVSLFRNDISGYIFPRDTGQLNYRTLLPTYQFTGLDALMVGSEFRFDIKPWNGPALGGSLTFVRGELSATRTPLPWMPPLSGRLDVRYNLENLNFGTTLRAAAAQERLGEFEQRTAGYYVYDLFGQYIFSAGQWLSSIDLVIANVSNTTYRRHLSRVKSIMPEPGRNIKLLYKVYF